jgi:DNA-binding XRE family transcriptional regulator
MTFRFRTGLSFGYNNQIGGRRPAGRQGDHMVSSRQIRAARALLGWTQQVLADRALVAVNSLRAIEAEKPYPKPETVQSVRRALEKGGIVFLEAGTLGEGVRLARLDAALRGRRPRPRVTARI